MSDAPPDRRVGQRIGGRFRLERPLGSGGAGMVYEALQEDLGRKVAIKLLRPELAEDHETLARFRREARAAAALGHPHIAQVLDFGEPRGGEPAFIAFELARGESLASLLQREERLELERAVKIARQVLAGLEAAHQAGIVHRDLKPANVFLADVPGVGETAKILDFGIAQVQEGEAFRRLTATGVVVGTPRYMSPEQLAGHTVDARSDLWAVGVLLYRMLTGRVPFDGKTGEVLGAIRTQPTPPMPAEAGVPPAIEDVVARALKKSPEDRWRSATEMSRALEGALATRGPARTRRMNKPTSSELDRPTMPDPELAEAVRTRALEAGHESLRPSLTTTRAGLPRMPGRAFYGGLAVAVLAALLAGLWGAFVWSRSAPSPPAPVAPVAPSLPVPDAPADVPAADAPAEAPARDAPPPRGTLASFLQRAEAHLAAEGAFRVASVRAVGLDRETSVLDFHRTDVATSLDLELGAPDGRCMHYAIATDRTEHAVARGGCGPALRPPLPDPVEVLARAASVCPGFAALDGPVTIEIRAGEAGAEIQVRDPSGRLGFDATSDAWAEIRVVPGSCRGEPTRRRSIGSDGVINPWGD